MRDPPRSGVKIKATIISAGAFNVADPCTIARVVAIDAPFPLRAREIGTIHAEQRLIGVPTIKPLNDPHSPPLLNILVPEEGNRNAPVNPATKKAKIIPGATSSKYVTENSHHREKSVAPVSTQNP
jgi:hypothetical protein